MELTKALRKYPISPHSGQRTNYSFPDTQYSVMKCCKFKKEIKKCCFCVPIWKGVITFGYINLVFCLLSLPLLFLIAIGDHTTKREIDEEDTMTVDTLIHLPLTIAFLLVDIILVVVLLVGAHKRNRKLLRVYFYCGVLLQILTLGVDLIYFDPTEYVLNMIYIIGIGINIYLLVLIYNLVCFMNGTQEVHYVPQVENLALP